MIRNILLALLLLSPAVHAVTVLKCDVAISEGFKGTFNAKSVLPGEARIMNYPDHFAVNVLDINQETPPLEVHILTNSKNVKNIIHRITVGNYIFTRGKFQKEDVFSIQDTKNNIRYLMANCIEIRNSHSMNLSRGYQ
jgi:hypothetical protein